MHRTSFGDVIFYTEEVARVKGQNVGTVSTEECLPPAQVFATDEIPTFLEPLFPANAEPKVCRSVCFIRYRRKKAPPDTGKESPLLNLHGYIQYGSCSSTARVHWGYWISGRGLPHSKF